MIFCWSLHTISKSIYTMHSSGCSWCTMLKSKNFRVRKTLNIFSYSHLSCVWKPPCFLHNFSAYTWPLSVTKDSPYLWPSPFVLQCSDSDDVFPMKISCSFLLLVLHQPFGDTQSRSYFLLYMAIGYLCLRSSTPSACIPQVSSIKIDRFEQEGPRDLLSTYRKQSGVADLKNQNFIKIYTWKYHNKTKKILTNE